MFLECILSKKYPSPSSDIISVLAGLEDADSVFSGFVATLDRSIRDGRSLEVRSRAVYAALAAVAGAYHTGIVSYFISRDLFPSLTKVGPHFSRFSLSLEGSEKQSGVLEGHGEVGMGILGHILP